MRLLIVDDCVELLDWLKLDLELRNHQIVAETLGEAALRRLSRESFDAVILDVMMPGEARLQDFLADQPSYLRGSVLRVDGSLFVKAQHQRRPFSECLEEDEWIRALAGGGGSRVEHLPVHLIHQVANDPGFRRDLGVLWIHFDGFTVCQLATSNREFSCPPIILFTAGASGRQDEWKDRARSVGARCLIFKSQYYEKLVPLLDELEQELG